MSSKQALEEGDSYEKAEPVEPTIKVTASEESAGFDSGKIEMAVQQSEPMEEVLSEESNEPSENNLTSPLELGRAVTTVVSPQHATVSQVELRRPREVAALLQRDDREEGWHDLLWSLIAADELPAAYWLARSLPAIGRFCPVPDWLLASAQGARWLTPDSDAFVGDLLEIVRTCQPAADEVQQLLGLAAALRPSLIASGSGLIGWLTKTDCCSPLSGIVDAINDFARLGRALRPEDLLGIAGVEQRAVTIVEATRAAKQWLEGALSRRTKMKRATDVWRHFVGPKGELRAMLLPVSEDQRSEVEQVRESMIQWRDRDHIVEWIAEIDREFIGKGGARLSGIRASKLYAT